VTDIHDYRGPVSHDGEAQRHAKLSGALAGAAELAHEVSVRIDDHDARGLTVENVQVAVLVEARGGDVTKRLPDISVERADAIHLLIVGAQRTVRTGQLDDLLGRYSVHRKDEGKNAPAHARYYGNVPHNLSLPSWSILHLRQV